MTNIHEDEIDLLELFMAIWDNKWIVISAMLISTLAGIFFIIYSEPKYEARVHYSADTIPPFYNIERASADFEKRFYSKSEFEYWKKSISNTSLSFEDFSMTKVVDGVILSRSEKEMLASLETKPGSGSSVLIQGNQLSILNDVFNYANHINLVLKNEYVLRAKEELKVIESRLQDLSILDRQIVETVLAIDRYIVAAEKDANVFNIKRPTVPRNISPGWLTILSISVAFGGIVGGTFALVRIAIRKRRQKLAKT